MGASKEHRRFRVITGAGAGLRRGSGRCGGGAQDLMGAELGRHEPRAMDAPGAGLKKLRRPLARQTPP